MREIGASASPITIPKHPSIERGALQRSVLERYRPRNLWKIVMFLQYEEHDVKPGVCKALLSQLRRFLQLRLKLAKATATEPVDVLRLESTSRLLRFVRLRQILVDPAVSFLLPAGAEGITDDIVVARRLSRP